MEHTHHSTQGILEVVNICIYLNIIFVSQIVGSNELMQVKEQSVCDLGIETLTIYAQNVSLLSVALSEWLFHV